MYQIIAANCAPVPVVYIKAVWPSDADGTGFYVIVVPQSPMAPHAVLVDRGQTGLRYPRRDGASTSNLSESEVASAYRQRDLGARQQEDRLRDIACEAVGRLDMADSWLSLALVPDLPGLSQISSASFRAFTEAMRGSSALVFPGMDPIYHQTRVGQRCYVSDDSYNAEDRHPYSTCLQVFQDGAASYSLKLHNINSSRYPGDSDDGVMVVSDEWLSLGVVSALHRLGSHARDVAMTNGNSVVRASVEFPEGVTDVRLGWRRGHGFLDSRKLTSPGVPVVSEQAVSIDDIATVGPQLVATAWRIGGSLVQAWGIPELNQLNELGEVRIPYWAASGGFRPWLTDWAKANGIVLSGT